MRQARNVMTVLADTLPRHDFVVEIAEHVEFTVTAHKSEKMLSNKIALRRVSVRRLLPFLQGGDCQPSQFRQAFKTSDRAQ